MIEIVSATRFAELRHAISAFCQNYIADFVKNEKHYAKQDGYHNRITAALIANDYLQKIAKGQKNQDKAKLYAANIDNLNSERKEILKGKKW